MEQHFLSIKEEVDPPSSCPFCGSANTSIAYIGQPSLFWFVMCNDCKAQGPLVFDSAARGGGGPPGDVITRWNDRS